MNQLQKDAKDKGNSGSSICDCKRNYFTPEPDKYIDMVIIPYRAGANNPLVRKKVIAQGEWIFSLDLLIHANMGIDKKDYICPQSWGEKCPICDLQYKIFKEQGKEAAQSLRAKKRSWLNISLCDQQGSRYGDMLVFNASYVLFTEKLLDAAISKNRGMGITPFADLEKGSVITCHTIQGVFGKNKFVDYASFDFGARAVPVPQEFVRTAICFEDHLKMPDINEMMDLASGSGNWQIQPRTEPTASSGYTQPLNPSQQVSQPISSYTQEPRPALAQQPAQVVTGEILCPSGLRFGEECDSQRVCHYCEVWEACKQQNKMVG
jgi:hypothetical protein